MLSEGGMFGGATSPAVRHSGRSKRYARAELTQCAFPVKILNSNDIVNIIMVSPLGTKFGNFRGVHRYQR